MANIHRHKRTTSATTDPSGLDPGQFAFNAPRIQLSIGDPTTGSPIDLLAVRFYNANSPYKANDFVTRNGVLLRCIADIPAHAFNSAEWAGAAAGLPEAPIDGTPYFRQSAGWVSATLANLGGVAEAPSDGKSYARNTTVWKQLAAIDVTYGVTTVSDALDNKVNPSDLTSNNVSNQSGVGGTNITTALNNLNVAISLKANSASPTLTGAPLAPTATALTSNTQIATTAYADNAVSVLSGTVNTALALKAPLASPTFTGTPAAPTPTVGDNSTKIATTAFVTTGFTTPAQVAASYTTPAQVAASSVAKAGDTMTGALKITKPWATNGDEQFFIKPTSGHAILMLDSVAGAGSNANFVQGLRAGVTRWTMTLGNGAPETGSNAGSDFALVRYSDTGVGLDTPLTINRQNGQATFSQPITCIGGNVIIKGVGSAVSIVQLLDSANVVRSQYYYNPANATSYFNNITYGSNLNLNTNVTAQPGPGGNFICNVGQGYQTTGGPWASLSDARIKTVQGEYITGLAAVLALHPVTYKFKGNSGFDADSSFPLATPDDTVHIGFVAQEAEVAMPEMVTKRDGFIDGQAVTDLRSLDTGPLTFALINAVKELNAQIQDLKAQIAVMKGTA